MLKLSLFILLMNVGSNFFICIFSLYNFLCSFFSLFFLVFAHFLPFFYSFFLQVQFALDFIIVIKILIGISPSSQKFPKFLAQFFSSLVPYKYDRLKFLVFPKFCLEMMRIIIFFESIKLYFFLDVYYTYCFFRSSY